MSGSAAAPYLASDAVAVIHAPPPDSAESWADNSFLYKVWRRREAQLMRILTVRNLAQTRRAFDEEKGGLTLARFMQIMLQLLGMWAINRDELVVQLLDLFCCIDVNGDGVRLVPFRACPHPSLPPPRHTPLPPAACVDFPPP